MPKRVVSVDDEGNPNSVQYPTPCDGDSVYCKSAFASDRKFITSLRIGSTIAGDRDEIVLCVTPIGNQASFLSSLTFRELL